MFYTTDRNDHGLPHDPFKAIVAPRPIGWISSIGANGAVNLAPYSYFNGVHSKPPMVMFASEGRKDSLEFIEETREFVCNLATWDLRGQMNQTSAPYPRGTNELEAAGLTPGPSRLVKPPRVAEAPGAPCRRRASRRGQKGHRLNAGAEHRFLTGINPLPIACWPARSSCHHTGETGLARDASRANILGKGVFGCFIFSAVDRMATTR